MDSVEKILTQIKGKIPYGRLVQLDLRARWGVAIGVPALILVLLYFLLISGKLEETAKLRDELATAQKDVQIKLTLEARLPEFEKKINDLNYQLELVKRKLPEEKEIPDLLDQISNLGTQSGLEFLTFKPLVEVERDFYAEVPVELKIIGKFHELLAFFDQVSRMPRIVTVSNLDIAQSSGVESKKGNLVFASCRAITFRFMEAKVDAGAQPAK